MSGNRKAGMLCPVFSLSSKYGIGSFGESAYEFVRFLKKSKQTYWQILPLVPISSDGNSPYLSPSTFAGNYMYIDIDKLIEDGLLTERDVRGYEFEDDFVGYDYVAKAKDEILRKAFENNKVLKIIDTENFSERELVRGFCLFEALKKHFNGKSWLEFPDDIKFRKKERVDYYEKLLKDEIEYNVFVQCLFYKQYFELKNYANDLGIKIFGDLPIYVSKESSDMWQNPDMFVVNEDLSPKLVAGVPPDRFSETGQYWGNPVYDWDYCEKTGFDWWLKRLKHNLKMYDVLRLDHFRGFEAYWRIPYQGSESDARLGQWVKGPGWDFFNHLIKELGPCPIIAENLGVQTSQLQRLIKKTNFPIMYVLQFAFSGQADNDHLPHAYQANSVAYVGTHDNETALGWAQNPTNYFHSLQASSYLNKGSDESISWAMNRGIAASPSKLAIYSMADLLELSNEARINTPSTLGNNWRWRITDAKVYESIKKPLIDLTATYFRYNEKNNP